MGRHPKNGNAFRLGEAFQHMDRCTFITYIIENYSFAPTTIEQRTYAVKSWENYCRIDGLHSRVLSSEAIQGYIAHQHLQGYALKGITTYLSGIGAWFMDHGTPQSVWLSTLKERDVQSLKRGVARHQSILGRETTHAPVMTLNQLKYLGDQTEASTDFDQILFCAIAVVAFFGLHRMNELIAADTETEFEIDKHMPTKSVILLQRGIKYTVMSQKTSYRVPETCFIIAHEWPEWASAAYLRYHFLRAQSIIRIHPAHFVTSQGVIPTYSWVHSRMRLIDPILTPHSPRVGGASLMAQNGSMPLTIQMKGRWASEAFITYVRVHPELLRELQQRSNLPKDFHR